MRSSVRTCEGARRRDATNKTRSADTRPATEIFERTENLACWSFWCQHPQGNDDAKEAKDRENENNNLEDWQESRSDGIHECADDSNQDHDKTLVPVLHTVCRIVYCDHGEKQDCSAVCGSCDQSLPTQCRQPADDITEESLLLARSEFRHPVWRKLVSGAVNNGR